MKSYHICIPEHENWCVPAALQTVLKRRGINVSQEEIAENFSRTFTNSNFTGFDFNEGLLNRFVGNYGLSCDFKNPFIDFELYQSSDIFLSKIKKTEKDLILAYDAKSFHNPNSKREQMGHLSVFIDYSSSSDLVKIMDVNSEREIPLNSILENMHHMKDINYGFYVIS